MRAVSGRLITYLEMNSTFRGAVEVFNLCRNLQSHDVLFAECVRTFLSYTLDAGTWLHRLETTQKSREFLEHPIHVYVPRTKKKQRKKWIQPS